MEQGRSRWGSRIVGVLMALVVLAVIIQIVAAYYSPQKAILHLGGHRFEARVADTDKTRTQGLSGTAYLPADEAMLFIFDTNSKWSIWMKDMNYPIDIVWLNEQKEVVDIVAHATPDSYPSRTFTPKTQARYVVEFKSGTVQQKGIRLGQQAVLSGTRKEL